MPRPEADPYRDRPVPGWFRDAKLGIFVHWGIYAVPGWAPVPGEGSPTMEGLIEMLPRDVSNMGELFLELQKLGIDLFSGEQLSQSPYSEWYWNSISNPGTESERHHREVWGGCDYREFAPRFAEAVEGWKAESWGALFADAGARYAVLTTKHHDGYCLWPTETPNRLHAGWHSERDLVGEFVAAMRGCGLRVGLYYSGGLDWSLRGIGMKNLGDMRDAIVQSQADREYMDAHVRELVRRFEPSLLWGDIGYPRDSDVHALFADYYERVPDGVVNDRFQTSMEVMDRHYDFKTTEYFAPREIQDEPWEMCEGIGPSFAYNQLEADESIKSSREILHRLVDVVSKNGNLLLGVGPQASGEIAAIQQERLREVGTWLRLHGEAVFGTRPWSRHAGVTRCGVEVRFTRGADALYAILLGKVGDRLVLEGSDLPASATPRLLGSDRPLVSRATADGLEITGIGGTPSVGAALRLGM